jgi:hypothetical protein
MNDLACPDFAQRNSPGEGAGVLGVIVALLRGRRSAAVISSDG